MAPLLGLEAKPAFESTLQHAAPNPSPPSPIWELSKKRYDRRAQTPKVEQGHQGGSAGPAPTLIPPPRPAQPSAWVVRRGNQLHGVETSPQRGRVLKFWSRGSQWLGEGGSPVVCWCSELFRSNGKSLKHGESHVLPVFTPHLTFPHAPRH